jgi:hypothetical protein
MSNLTFDQHNAEEKHGNNLVNWLRDEMKRAEKIEDPNLRMQQIDKVQRVAVTCDMLQKQVINEENQKHDEAKFLKEIELEREAFIEEMKRDASSIDSDSNLTGEEKQKAKVKGAKQRIQDMLKKRGLKD